jgi:hypothetical protein
MQVTPEHNARIAKMTFASVYPHYIKKVESKGRTRAELHEVIEWLTGFDNKKIQNLIKGLICGYRIEEIDNPLTKQARYLDKLVDELAKGKKMEKILRTE